MHAWLSLVQGQFIVSVEIQASLKLYHRCGTGKRIVSFSKHELVMIYFKTT